MPFKGEDFQWTRGEAAADATSGRYGEEHDDRITELVNFENGSRKFWSDKLREMAKAEGVGMEASGLYAAARLLDPYRRYGAAEGFGRTEATGDAGALWFAPEK
jgi:hypothetical protein